MTVTITRGAEGLGRRAFSVADVERMLDVGVLDRDEKFELIRGEIVPMNAQLAPHAILKSRIGGWFSRRLDEAQFDVAIDVTVRLGGQGLLEPDVLICRKLIQIKREYLPIEAALLVVEVADTSLERDRDIKAPDYAQAGLPELWIVDLTARETLVHRLDEKGHWVTPTPVPFDAPLSALFAPSLLLTMSALA